MGQRRIHHSKKVHSEPRTKIQSYNSSSPVTPSEFCHLVLKYTANNY